ncbi:NADH-quinone oxidoreductase subunit C [Microlunatus sp. Gsoil 973]|uniref:NADH-quinone oxidoreductase subunit C n=1 Tax=Microlunatus sp. Gsoil 973 TaxID=2672569 RepID=UPI0012B46A00|nr:NADH-quinone oxidoreductase subunit C [Microlunatus sp. Gsoil 973]QGN34849.1 NADH-quinone oxidoreductase subunit C [Microlunatus sp. Gsoil 973]
MTDPNTPKNPNPATPKNAPRDDSNAQQPGKGADEAKSSVPSTPPDATPGGGPEERGDLEPTPTGPGSAQGPEILAVRDGMFGVKGSPDTSGYGRLRRVIEFPGPSQRPFGSWYDSAIDRIAELMPNVGEVITKVVVERGDLTVHVAREHLVALMKILRDDAHLRFEFFSGVSGVHYPTDKGRELHAVYHLGSFTHNRRIRIEVSVSEADPHIPSVVGVYPGADWHERETFDMFGMIFDGHPHLTRILMPDDWPGHPQRKEYPLGGIDVEYKGARIPSPDNRRSYN